jgi:PAS domain-containing protein
MYLLLAFLLGVAITAFISLGYAVWQRIENEQMMRSIIQGSPIPAFVIRKDHRVLYWNKSLEALSGLKPRNIIGTKEHWRAFYQSERPCLADPSSTNPSKRAPTVFGEAHQIADS